MGEGYFACTEFDSTNLRARDGGTLRMQGERVPRSPTQTNGLGYDVFQAGCTPHLKTPPKVRVGDDTSVTNSLNFYASAPRPPVRGRRVELRAWE